MTDPLDYARHLPLPDTHNFRDVGGYETAGSGHIRWRTLFRSDSLHRLDSDAQQEIVSLGVRTIVDLRHLRETEQQPNAFAASRDVRYLNAPIVAFPAPKRLAESLEELNRVWLEHCQDQIAGVFARLGEPDAFPSVVHCAIGKDRTGLIIALLLRLA
ncbi:MAG: tyrosine-protein phosphatase, partial [Dehalococcoidia bacterium]